MEMESEIDYWKSLALKEDLALLENAPKRRKIRTNKKK